MFLIPGSCAGYTLFQLVDVSHQTILPPLCVLIVVGDIRQLLHNAMGTHPRVAQLTKLTFCDRRGV